MWEQAAGIRKANRDWTGEDPLLSPAMPVLQTLSRDLGPLDGDVEAFFGLQHLFGSTSSLIRTLARDRIEPDAVFLLGKPYSANRRVVRFLRNDLGYRVHPASCIQPLRRACDEELDLRIGAMLESIRQRLAVAGHSSGRVLLIDDGGRAIRMLHTERFADIRERFTCVEQTRCGIRTLEGLELRVPVVNVAESWVKLDLESPMIAGSVNRELSKQLNAMERSGIPTGRSALVIGYGAIGRAVATEFRRRGRRITVFDTEEGRLARARNDGHAVREDLRSALQAAQLIIGCTGTPVLDHEDYDRLPHGAILVSASSSDVEFRAWQLRAGGDCLGRPETWHAESNVDSNGSGDARDRSHPCFSLYRVHRNGRLFYLVNGGFPVNFSGAVDPIEPREIQLTRGLLYLGAVQASRTTAPGFHSLADRLQRVLVGAFTEQSGRQVA